MTYIAYDLFVSFIIMKPDFRLSYKIGTAQTEVSLTRKEDTPRIEKIDELEWKTEVLIGFMKKTI